MRYPSPLAAAARRVRVLASRLSQNGQRRRPMVQRPPQRAQQSQRLPSSAISAKDGAPPQNGQRGRPMVQRPPQRAQQSQRLPSSAISAKDGAPRQNGHAAASHRLGEKAARTSPK